MSLVTRRALLRLQAAYKQLLREDLSHEQREGYWEEEIDTWLCQLSQLEIIAIVHTLTTFRGS